MPNLLVDSNILLLLVIGSWDADAIPKHRRTADVFTPADFVALQHHVQQYGTVLTTAAVLTEVGNLMGNDFHKLITPTLITVCTPFVEVTRSKGDVFSHAAFDRLGFADVSILLALDDATTLLTDDFALYNQALYEEREAVNFNHLRSYAR